MHALTLDEETFAAVKDSYKRMIANAQFDAAYAQVLYEGTYLTTKDMIHRSKLYDPASGVDLISSVSLNEVKAFARETLFASVAIEGAAYGNLDPAEIKQGVNHFLTKLSPHPLDVAHRPENRQIKIPAGKTYVHVLPSSSNNNCWLGYLQIGPRTPQLNALLRVALSHLRDSFFNELRTNQQLGYVVLSNFHNSEKSLGLDFVIQSAQYSPQQIAERVKTWQQQALSELEQLPEEEFAAFKAAVATDLREKDKTMGDRHQSLLIETTIFGGMFDYKEQTAKAAEALSKEEMLAVFRQAFNPEHSSALNVHFHMQKSKDLTPPAFGELINNSVEFKANIPVF
jgi:insulysin